MPGMPYAFARSERFDEPGLQVKRHRLGPQVVLDEVHDRQVVHGAKIQRLVEVAARRAAVPRVGDGDVAVLLQLVGERDSGGDDVLRGHGRGGREHAQRRVAVVARVRLAAIGRDGAREDLREDRLERNALADRRRQLAVRRPDEVLLVEAERGHEGDRLLPDRRVHVAEHAALAEELAAALVDQPRRVQAAIELFRARFGQVGAGETALRRSSCVCSPRPPFVGRTRVLGVEAPRATGPESARQVARRGGRALEDLPAQSVCAHSRGWAGRGKGRRARPRRAGTRCRCARCACAFRRFRR